MPAANWNNCSASFRKKMPNLFAYGGLMLPANLELLTSRTYPHTDARLRGFARLRVGRQCRPGIKRKRDAQTRGVLYFSVSHEDLELVAQYLREDFEPVTVRLVTCANQITTAITHLSRNYQTRQWSYEPWNHERLCRVYSQSDPTPFGFNS